MRKQFSSTRRCEVCAQSFSESASERGLRARVADGVLGEIVPALCPRCRYQRRLANRNEWNFYHRKCSASGSQIISIYSADKPFPVYSADYWWSQRWDPLAYGLQIDFTKPLFTQIAELRARVPRICLTAPNSVNSLYTNQGSDNRNCYVTVATNFSERCLYVNWCQRCRMCVDCYLLEDCTECYECLRSSRLRRCGYLSQCSDCTNCWFSTRCSNSSNLFGCHGLSNASYCIYNRKVSRRKWNEFFRSTPLTRATVEESQHRVRLLSAADISNQAWGLRNVEATGDDLFDCIKVHGSFNCREARDLYYCQDAWKVGTGLDQTETLGIIRSAEIEGSMNCIDCFALCRSWDVERCWYSELCFDSSDLVGCIGIRNGRFCILNQRYSETEFLKLKKRLLRHLRDTGELGEFFPASISSFGYNESMAQEYFPLPKSEVLKRGWQWAPLEDRRKQYIGPEYRIPESICDVLDEITKKILLSEDTGAPYRVIPEELQSYRALALPVPGRSPDSRRAARRTFANLRQSWIAGGGC